MTTSILYVEVDVDDKNFHGTGFCIKTGELIKFKTKSTSGTVRELGSHRL